MHELLAALALSQLIVFSQAPWQFLFPWGRLHHAVRLLTLVEQVFVRGQHVCDIPNSFVIQIGVELVALGSLD
jgi:hypothetical protein